MSKYDEVLKPFTAMMEAELYSNSAKGDRPAWLSMTAEQCLLEIYYHVSKLQKAVRDGNGDRIKENTADVANMAMMLADICGELEIAQPSDGALTNEGAEPMAFQDRVQPWMTACFGEAIASDRQERNHRFLEEALELVQACGATADEAHQLVDYVYGRAIGEPSQEVGGVMVTLAALCLAQDMDMHQAGETELARIWTKVEQIRAKQLAKPAIGPLPGIYPDRESKTCTCPSGDGSLRWSCPVHPPEVKALVLPDHKDQDLRSPVHGYAKGWNACLDRVKELNS